MKSKAKLLKIKAYKTTKKLTEMFGFVWSVIK